MKHLIWLVAFLSSPVFALTPVNSGVFSKAGTVAQSADIQCAGTPTIDANGNPQMVVTDCVVSLAVQENGTVMNFCYRFASYDLLNAALVKQSLYSLAYTTKSTMWSWFPAFQSPPADVDSRCL